MAYAKPNDSPCGICGGTNDHFDDCGFFYLLKDKVHPSCTDYETWSGGRFFVPCCGCEPTPTGER
jgi:hypothetical protein